MPQRWHFGREGKKRYNRKVDFGKFDERVLVYRVGICPGTFWSRLNQPTNQPINQPDNDLGYKKEVA